MLFSPYFIADHAKLRDIFTYFLKSWLWYVCIFILSSYRMSYFLEFRCGSKRKIKFTLQNQNQKFIYRRKNENENDKQLHIDA